MGTPKIKNTVERIPGRTQNARGALGEIAQPTRDRIARLEARALRERWGLTDEKIESIAANLRKRVSKASNRDAATITSALNGLMNYGLAESKFELEKFEAENGPKSGGTTVNVGVGVSIQQQYEERVAGRDYDELCAEIAAEAAAVTKQLEGR